MLTLQSGNTVLRSETLTVRPTWKARMRSVTQSGAYLLANRKMEVGSRLRLRIKKGEPITLRVTRCAAQATGGWALACVFEARPGKDVLQTLKPALSVLDQRQSLRLPCSTLARFRSGSKCVRKERCRTGFLARPAGLGRPTYLILSERSKQVEEMGVARLADVSARGVCLITDPPLSHGDILDLELGVAKPIHAIGRVTYARQQSSGACIVGCHLDHGLVQDELWQLVSDVP